MSQVVDAVYENGVFKPLQDVKMKDHERVQVKIISLDDWQLRFDRIIGKIQQKAINYSSDEIEADIADAVREVRRERRDR